MKHLSRPIGLAVLLAFTLLLGGAVPLATASSPHAGPPRGTHRTVNLDVADSGNRARIDCEDGSPICTEVYDTNGYNGAYIGHDEPSVLFYSQQKGSGNNNEYHLTLPKDPPTAPLDNGSGGTASFQLHPAFWFGMAMCDTQSYPEHTTVCNPDTDANIFTSTNSADPKFMGNAPGVAFMEMQFYPPGWVLWPAGNSCDATKWCAALNIDSLSENPITGQLNNATCLSDAGLEYVNFAFITKNGVSHAPASPLLATLATFTPDPAKDFFMNSGDELIVKEYDTKSGLRIVVNDQTTHTSGSMTASAANGFGEVLFDPAGANCDPANHNLPTDFHPMYSTTSEDTRVMWAAHSYNIAFSDEIGHFDNCYGANPISPGGDCPAGNKEGDGEAADPAIDDNYCFPASSSSHYAVGGCINPAGNPAFDGTPYRNTWPGTLVNAVLDSSIHSTPIRFSSPKTGFPGFSHQYSRVAFETDLSRVESYPLNGTPPGCDRLHTGINCTNPPLTDDNNPASFYPMFTTHGSGGGCLWQEGGAHLPGTTNTFGGTSTTEYGPLIVLNYLTFGGGGAVNTRYNDFRNVLSRNPCG